MNGDGGRGGFNQGRGYQGRNFNPAYAGRGAGRGRFPSGGGGGGSGPGGGRFNGNNNRSGFFQGESSGTVGNRENDFGGGDFQENRGGNSANFHRGSNSNNNFRNSSGYAGNQSGRQYNGNNNLRSSGYNGRFADGRNAFNGNNGSANYNRSSGTGANIRVSSEVDDAFLQKTVAAVVAAVTAAQKPPEYVAQHGSVVRGDVSTANTGSEPSGAVPQGGDLPTEHVVQPVAPQTQAQEKALVADVPKPKEVEGAGPAKKKKLDKNGTYKPKVENPRLAKVMVEGETMTIPDIIENLKRIVPYDNFNWEVYHFQNNIYRVKFPNRNEVHRLKKIGIYICPGRPSEMTFDFWSALEEPLYMLLEVWMRVSGIPSDIRSDFLSLWGVGSMFGKTVEVDMAFTRKNKVLRIKIGCINPSLIPQDSDLFIKRGFFKLHFEVEMGIVEQDADMIEANGGRKDDDGSDGFDGVNKDKEEDNDGRGNEMEMDGANEHTNKEASNTMEINENEGHKGKQAALDRSSMEFKFGTFVSQVKLSGSDKAETESTAAMCPLTLMATPAPSSPMIAAETVACMGAEEESLHILPEPTSSLHVTRDKINGAGHVLRAEEIK
ncbi:hypothetical protein ACQ4PT_037344 [Festuca glaucescens]